MNYAFVAFDGKAPPEYWDNEGCKCKFLSKENLCTKFEHRPSACRFKPTEFITSFDIATFCDKLRSIELEKSKYLALKKGT